MTLTRLMLFVVPLTLLAVGIGLMALVRVRKAKTAAERIGSGIVAGISFTWVLLVVFAAAYIALSVKLAGFD